MIEPSLEVIELFLSESEKMVPPTIEVLMSQLDAQLQSLRHGLGIVQQKLTDLTELPGAMLDPKEKNE